MMNSKSLVLALMLALAASACGSSSKPAEAPAPQPSSTADLVDTAVAAGTFTVLVKAVQEAGLVDTLKGAGPFTLFAPTDAAFAKLPPGALEGLLADKAKLTTVLTYHVVPGSVSSAAVAGLKSLKTVQGAELTVHGVQINDATILQADIAASNGVIHAIDTVLMPSP